MDRNLQIAIAFAALAVVMAVVLQDRLAKGDFGMIGSGQRVAREQDPVGFWMVVGSVVVMMIGSAIAAVWYFALWV